MIDLHTHSRFSDGQDTPEELVQKAAAAGISVLALTDHDTAGGVPAAQEAGSRCGVTIIPGIEISAEGYAELHILGYGIHPEDAGLHDFTERNNANRRERASRIIQFLNEQGIAITLEDVKRYNDGRCSGRPHFAAALMQMGYVSSIAEGFSKYLSTPEYYKIERRKPSAEKGIAMIRNAGGIAVLAHPYSLKLEDEAFCAVLEELIGYGLSGIECYYSKHTPEQVAYYASLAERYGLCKTCGSDYHGPAVKPDIALGRGIADSLIRADVPEKEILDKLSQAGVDIQS